ncbi:MAG: DUF6503 family protein, partial [Bacteroidota bacterium]
QKSIAYHDPQGNWKGFQGNFKVTMEKPGEPDRISDIKLDFLEEQFILKVSKQGDHYQFSLDKDSCVVSLNGNTKPASKDVKRLRLTCDRGTMYRDYYTYLYGLPMKLLDPGTQIDPLVQRKAFHGNTYRVLRVTYEATVGKDIWYFYFNPSTYALEAYQFYHDEDKNDGEYILLEAMETVQGIKMPKVRKWYYNKDDVYLGADILN